MKLPLIGGLARDNESSRAAEITQRPELLRGQSRQAKGTPQEAANKVASIIMTPPTRVGHPGIRSWCPSRLNGHQRPQSESRRHEAAHLSDNNNKSNIINNNNINNNNYSSRQTAATSRQSGGAFVSSHTSGAVPTDRPETMKSCWQTPAAAAATVDLTGPPELRLGNGNQPATSNRHCGGVLQRRLAATKRPNNAPMLRRLWSLTLLTLIAYELYLQARQLPATLIFCQRCLPDVDVAFIVPCKAAQLLLPTAAQLPPTQEAASNISALPTSLFITNSSSSSTRSVQQEHTTTTTIAQANNNKTINNATYASPANGGVFTTTTAALTRSAVNSTINKYHQQQHNVLCNSRCNCVILEPLPPAAPRNSSAAADLQAELGSQRPPGGSGSSQQMSTPASGTQQTKWPQNSAQTVATANESSSLQQQPQTNLEQALIAFNEDYSLDYEQQPAGSGNGLDDAGGLDVVGDPGAGSDRTVSRSPGDQSNAPAEASIGVKTVAQVNAGNNGSVNSTTLQPAHPLSGGGGSELQSAQTQQQVNQSASIGGSYVNEIIANSTLDVASSGSRQRQKQQPESTTTGEPQNATSGKQQINPHAVQSKESSVSGPATPLFPLPPAHLLHLGGGAKSHHGRESSSAQLYAQSLYSSQAPKLSYHAHSPYLKSSAGAGLDPLERPAGGANVQAMSTAPTMGGGHQYGHHLRSGYIGAHHQRIGGGGKRFLAGSMQTYQKLVPLRSLYLSNYKLAWNSSGAGSGAQPDWTESVELAQRVRGVLSDIESTGAQSLVLRNNSLQFELWSELYALLAVSMRQHLFHLDLSHNSLTKLGITFTGYIEHHLAWSHGNWPFSAATANQTNGPMAETDPQRPPEGQASQRASSGKLSTGAKTSGGGRLKHTLLSGGKFYTLVRRLMAPEATNNGTTNTQQIGNTTVILQQPMLIRALDLSHNKLKWLINDQFRALKHVQTIRLDYNRIRYINQHAFSGLESLRFLNLNFNRLQALMLRSNYLAYLRGGSFASLANLRRLDLSRNKLTIMSNNALVGLESLELLNCSSNQFVHAPSASLHPLTNLRQLDLSDNLITQLAPGTFFHLPIEELWLNQNEQLVAIDRGAFWDLPYLRHLHLKWNPMLMSVNSQAFVGTQSLQSIDVEGCQSLESGTKQMLDNITMAATSRLLRYEQSRLNHSAAAEAAELASPAHPNAINTTLSSNEPPSAKGNRSAKPKPRISALTTQLRDAMARQTQLSLKVLSLFGLLGFAILATKLVSRLSSTRLIEERRRQRRVYALSKMGDYDDDEDDDDDGHQSMPSRCASEPANIGFPMCTQQPDNIVIPAAVRRCHAHTSTGDPRDEANEPPVGQQAEEPQEDGDETGNSNDISVISDSYCLSWPQPTPPPASTPPGGGSVEASASSAAPCCDPTTGQHLPVTSPTSTSSSDSSPVHSRDDVESSQPQSGGQDQEQPIQQQQQVVCDLQQQQQSSIDLIHSQLIAAGFDYGHANCAHFYQSLGPALQLADMTANFVGTMDYY